MDVRGNGGSSAPPEPERYTLRELAGDVAAVAAALGDEPVVLLGHDWGAPIAWTTAIRHPDRVRAVAGLGVPHTPPLPFSIVDLLDQLYAGRFFYMLHFQEPGVAEADLGRDPATTMRRMLCASGPEEGAPIDPSVFANDGRGFVDRIPEADGLPDWLTQDELDHYIAEFTRTGFTGGLNWYRNFDRNWETTAELDGAKISVPCLFIGGTADPVLSFTRTDRAADAISGPYQQVMIDGAGHWLQQERPDEVNAALLEFLNGLEL
jgi:pimeloyl-ACP methyl ester carboxylesterase